MWNQTRTSRRATPSGSTICAPGTSSSRPVPPAESGRTSTPGCCNTDGRRTPGCSTSNGSFAAAAAATTRATPSASRWRRGTERRSPVPARPIDRARHLGRDLPPAGVERVRIRGRFEPWVDHLTRGATAGHSPATPADRLHCALHNPVHEVVAAGPEPLQVLHHDPGHTVLVFAGLAPGMRCDEHVVDVPER